MLITTNIVACQDRNVKQKNSLQQEFFVKK